MKNLVFAIGAGTIGLIVILALLVMIGLYVMNTYNSLVSMREFVRNSMGNIATQIESRWDALKSMIDATKKYSEHESQVLQDITASRSGVNKNSSAADVKKDDALFEQAISRLNVVVENYPQLKANDLYIKTMDNIDKYENNVRMSRMVYNDTVTKLNRTIQQFPSSIVASMFGFTQSDYFQNTESKKDMPTW